MHILYNILTLSGLTDQQRRREERLRDVPDEEIEGVAGYEDAVLHGDICMDTSHVDGMDSEWEDTEGAQDMLEELRRSHNRLFTRYRDPRTRRDRVTKLVNAFALQLDAMVDAYEKWRADCEEWGGFGAGYVLPDKAEVESTWEVRVVDIFSSGPQVITFTRDDQCVPAAFVRQGLLPTSPIDPGLAFTIRTLEVFRAQHLRCPRFSIQAFVRSLNDMHGLPPAPHLSNQFSVAFDVYSAIRESVDLRIQRTLGRDTPDWRLRNACPACTYTLVGEPILKVKMLVTLDGNNSLKRFNRRERAEGNDGQSIPGASKEREDSRAPPGDYYLTPEQVDKWVVDGTDELVKGSEKDLEDGNVADGCSERWQNMKDDVTARAYGLYDETGVVLSLCRHGFVLSMCDMIRSGELAKYGFAITAHLINALGEICLGYDIGCRFDKMVKSHPVLGKIALENNFKSVVGSFHGAAHNRQCQLQFLTLYIQGLGQEALEICESFFSKSNAVAATTRYASRFHRQQAIVHYVEHADTFDAYANLSSLLCAKYNRALDTKANLPSLVEMMEALDVQDRQEFEVWRQRERDCLARLSQEPIEETLQMEYYQKRVNLAAQEESLLLVRGMDAIVMPAPNSQNYAEAIQKTRHLETQRRHAQQLHDKGLVTVQDLERRLGIVEPWVIGDNNWRAAAELVSKRRYQRALDNLQKLVIMRMMELMKANLAGTGYKLQKHIAKQLQARSKALKHAITKYNEAAVSIIPPRPTLSWEEVVDYAFLADFDLLRLGHEDIRDEKWTSPAGRRAVDLHYQLLRADEEIERLNVEIPRLLTYMEDEQRFLSYHEARLQSEGNRGLAFQVQLLRMKRGRFDNIHRDRLTKLSRRSGFTATMANGKSLSRERDVPSSDAGPTAQAGRGVDAINDTFINEQNSQSDDSDEDADDAEGDGLDVALSAILQLGMDDDSYNEA
ncbi:unnamed protein product [Mycena citricolor]|uniref:CxC2-like cysteine cluster KDZ transposase-associated domain-containing protein n=1 Tax=Mycena citricolor TaxID=2018698 RepID=A0AAD2GVS9_9AGAR|nr:unnamed protein product [Mycena citricolor]